GGPRAGAGEDRGTPLGAVAGVRREWTGSVPRGLLAERERDVRRRGRVMPHVVPRLLELPLERAALPPPHPHEAEAAAGGAGGADDTGVRAPPVLGEPLDEAGVEPM